MPTMIFVNVAVDDLATSKAFYEALGWSINPHFTDDNAACVVISDTIHLMVLVKPFFQQFTSKSIVDATVSNEMQLSLSADSKEEVDSMLAKALAAGGTASGSQDFGFMYSKSFDDPDGHHWDVMWMDPVAAAGGGPQLTEEELRAGISTT